MQVIEVPNNAQITIGEMKRLVIEAFPPAEPSLTRHLLILKKDDVVLDSTRTVRSYNIIYGDTVVALKDCEL